MCHAKREEEKNMNPYIDQLKKYLAEREPDYGVSDVHSLLEMLWDFYTEFNPVDNERIREKTRELGAIFESLPLKEGDQLFYMLSDLCLEVERAAFLNGIHVGVRLAEELSQIT